MDRKVKKLFKEQSEPDIASKTAIILFFAIALSLFYKTLFWPAAGADIISQWYPFGKYRIEYFFNHFDIPLWHPYINGGVPELDVGFPFSFTHIITMSTFANLKTTFAIAYTIIIIFSGIFSFIFFRSLKMGNFAAFLTSLIYMLSGDMISYFYPGHLGKPLVMALIPLALYFLESGFKSKKLIYFPIIGIILGQSYLRHPQIFYYFLLFFSSYFLFKLYLLYRQEKRFKTIITGIIWYSLVGIFAVFTALPSLAVQYSYHKLTSRGTLKNEIEMWNFATSWSHHPLELLTYFIPSIFGLYDATYLGWKPFVQTTDYLGVITIILAIIGIVTKWKDRITKFNFFALIIMTLFGFGKHFASYYKLFYNYVPLIKKFRVPASIYLVTTFIIVYFAFWGVVAILNARDNRRIKDIIKKILVIVIIFLFIISVWLYTDSYKQILRNNLSQRININAIIQKYGFQGEQYINSIIAKTSDMAKSDMWKMWLWVVFFSIIYFSFVSAKTKKKTFQILLVIIILLDLYIVDKKFIKTVENYNIIDKETSVIKFLKQDKDKFRILPLLNTNEANKWCLFKIESVTGYHAAGLKIYEDIMKAGLLNNLNFLGLFNVKYIISQKPLNIKDIEMVFQGTDNGRIVYKNKRFLPRYFLVDKFMVIENPDTIISMLKENRINLKDTIILEENPQITSDTKLSIKNNKVEMIKWDTDIIKFKCEIKNPVFLFLSEVYYPKWRAYIGDKEVKIYKTDYLFRSVLLRPGNYILTFKFYNNHSYLITAIIHYFFSIIGVVLIVKLLKQQKALA